MSERVCEWCGLDKFRGAAGWVKHDPIDCRVRMAARIVELELVCAENAELQAELDTANALLREAFEKQDGRGECPADCGPGECCGCWVCCARKALGEVERE